MRVNCVDDEDDELIALHSQVNVHLHLNCVREKMVSVMMQTVEHCHLNDVHGSHDDRTESVKEKRQKEVMHQMMQKVSIADTVRAMTMIHCVNYCCVQVSATMNATLN